MSNSIIIDHSIKLIKVLKSCETPAQYEVAYRMFVNFQKLYRNILNDELDWLDLNVYEEFRLRYFYCFYILEPTL